MTPVSLMEWSFAALVALVVFSVGVCLAYQGIRFVWTLLSSSAEQEKP